MSGETDLIEIDAIVLTGVDRRDSGRLTALVEAEVRRALGGAERSPGPGPADAQPGIAAEVARAVARSVGGGRDVI